MDDFIAEYHNLRAKVNKQVSMEFTELQNFYNNSFYSYKIVLQKPNFLKSIFYTKKGILFFASVFWLVYVCVYLLV
jgi:hypothetical protein